MFWVDEIIASTKILTKLELRLSMVSSHKFIQMYRAFAKSFPFRGHFLPKGYETNSTMFCFIFLNFLCVFVSLLKYVEPLPC